MVLVVVSFRAIGMAVRFLRLRCVIHAFRHDVLVVLDKWLLFAELGHEVSMDQNESLLLLDKMDVQATSGNARYPPGPQNPGVPQNKTRLSARRDNQRLTIATTMSTPPVF